MSPGIPQGFPQASSPAVTPNVAPPPSTQTPQNPEQTASSDEVKNV